ncbi:MAG: TIM-barrel domain-containing protein [Candidatus Sulfotelmatobacter sp.]
MSTNPLVLRTREMTVNINQGPIPAVNVIGTQGNGLTESDPLSDAGAHRATFERTSSEPIYGIRGIGLDDPHPTIVRDQGGKVQAGVQGNGGAPFFFTAHYGVFIDSNGGAFATSGKNVTFSGDSRAELEYFIIVGPPLRVMAGLADLTGHPPMSPKWTLGFLNSQWGSNEKELKEIVNNYRSKHIPLDGFILDFDWKAWGEDNYGEWRWNSTSGPGNVEPDKFPDGASGLLARQMLSQGVHLTGILKPRILVYKPGSTTELQEAAAYAEEHHLWYPNEPNYEDYFTHRLARDLDFRLPATRAWIWKHLEPAFDAGMQGWWNDEADYTQLPDKSDFIFDNYQFFSMARMLYEEQRTHSNLRVWSINRNFYVGAQRFGYAEWSGDIDTGFASMRKQTSRMLATLNLGEPHWSMDTGGFHGHPTPENYARWMQFAAFVPVFRVHGDFNEKRQPWVYGPTAQAAATWAMRLRYQLMPYIYSAERHSYETGIGIVRPLLWIFPSDPTAAAQENEWMFGDALLVAPVFQPEAKERSVYLPAGHWYEYSSGRRFAGGQSVTLNVDSKTWLDLPLFIRDGSILATQRSEDYTTQFPVTEVTLDVFPSDAASRFVYYDDDGATYAYEKGEFYRQRIAAVRAANLDSVNLETPKGTFPTALRTFLIRVHGRASHSVSLNGTAMAHQATEQLLLTTPGPAWTASEDRFGPLTLIRVEARSASKLVLR